MEFFEITIPVSAWREDDQIVIWSPALDIATQGDTEAEAKKNFEEALDLWVETAIQENMLEEALESCGFEKKTENCGWSSPYAPLTKDSGYSLHIPKLAA